MFRQHGPTLLRTTPRVALRRLTAADQEEFTALAQASEELHRPWINIPQTAAEFAAYLARFDGKSGEGLVVCRQDTQAIAGFFNIGYIVREPFHRGTLGYGAFAPSAGLGYMTEGLAQVLAFAFNDLGLHRIEADIQPGNQASIDLVRRAGFRLEGYSPGYIRINGTWRDHERWAITVDAHHPVSP